MGHNDLYLTSEEKTHKATLTYKSTQTEIVLSYDLVNKPNGRHGLNVGWNKKGIFWRKIA